MLKRAFLIMVLAAAPALADESMSPEQRLFQDYQAMENSLNAANMAKYHVAEDLKEILAQLQWYKNWHRGFDSQQSTLPKGDQNGVGVR